MAAPRRVLGSMRFFDGKCAAVHVHDKHTIAFAPVVQNHCPNSVRLARTYRSDSMTTARSVRRPTRFLLSPLATGVTAFARFLTQRQDRYVSAGATRKAERFEATATEEFAGSARQRPRQAGAGTKPSRPADGA